MQEVMLMRDINSDGQLPNQSYINLQQLAALNHRLMNGNHAEKNP